jgi:prolyl-tRNA synthetase
VDVDSVAEAVEAAATGWARVPWAKLGAREAAVLAENGVTVRCLVLPDGSVPEVDDAPDALAIVGRAY